MALTRSFHNTIDVNTHMNKLWIALKRYNTYSVVPRKPCTSQGSLHYRLATLGYQKYNAYSVETRIL